MNVKVPKLTTVIPTLCVRTLKDPMSAAVLKALREMVKSAQKSLFVILLALQTKCARIVAVFLNVYVQMVLAKKKIAQTLMSVQVLN